MSTQDSTETTQAQHWTVSTVGRGDAIRWRVRSADGSLISDLHGLHAETNARLIAAAPDMLAALVAVVLSHDVQAAEDRRDAGMAPPFVGPCSCGECDEARAAIARAKGGAS